MTISMIAMRVSSMGHSDSFLERKNSENIEDFGGFIKAVIDDSLDIGDRSDVFFKFPKLKHFIEGAKVVHDLLVSNPIVSEMELKGMFLPELTMAESYGFNRKFKILDWMMPFCEVLLLFTEKTWTSRPDLTRLPLGGTRKKNIWKKYL